MNEKNVTSGKPKVGGAIFSAPLGTVLPTDAKTALAETFIALGYVSEDGVSNENSPETETIKAWGGDTVLVSQSGKEDIFKYKLIETMNIETLKQVYGDDNVTGAIDEASGITIKANSKSLEARSIVIEMLLKNDILKRIVIPNATVSEIGEVLYVDDDVTGYELTLHALPDTTGNTHYEYIQDPKVSA